MDQEVLLLPVFKLEKHVLLLDAEADFSSSDVDSCLGSPQEWSPKNELDSEVVLYIHCHEIRKNEGVSHSHQDVLNYPFGILHCWICELHTHLCRGKSKVLMFFVYYLGHYVHACPQIAHCMLVVLVINWAADHGDPWILLHWCHQAIPIIILWGIVPTYKLNWFLSDEDKVSSFIFKLSRVLSLAMNFLFIFLLMLAWPRTSTLKGGWFELKFKLKEEL